MKMHETTSKSSLKFIISCISYIYYIFIIYHYYYVTKPINQYHKLLGVMNTNEHPFCGIAFWYGLTWKEAGVSPLRALFAQTERAVMVLRYAATTLIQKLQQSPPPPEIHSELIKQSSVHKMVLVRNWEKEREINRERRSYVSLLELKTWTVKPQVSNLEVKGRKYKIQTSILILDLLRLLFY